MAILSDCGHHGSPALAAGGSGRERTTLMPTPVVMPQMGESIAEGTIVRWLKKVGDPVDRDEPLFEISTDKVDAEIPSPAAGVLTEISAHEGETVAVNSVVASIAAPGEAQAAAPAAQAAAQPSRGAEKHAATGRRRRTAGEDAHERRRCERVCRVRSGERRSPPPEVVAARATHRARARRRYHADPRNRDRRSGDEARHPRVHRHRVLRRVRFAWPRCSAGPGRQGVRRAE